MSTSSWPDFYAISISISLSLILFFLLSSFLFMTWTTPGNFAFSVLHLLIRPTMQAGCFARAKARPLQLPSDSIMTTRLINVPDYMPAKRYLVIQSRIIIIGRLLCGRDREEGREVKGARVEQRDSWGPRNTLLLLIHLSRCLESGGRERDQRS